MIDYIRFLIETCIPAGSIILEIPMGRLHQLVPGGFYNRSLTDVWKPRWDHRLCCKLFPFELSKPRLIFEVLDAKIAHSQPLCWILLAQANYDTLRVFTNICWEVDLVHAFADLLVDSHDIWCIEWRTANHNDVRHNTKSPPINPTVVPSLSKS